jgi:hypothetical protein
MLDVWIGTWGFWFRTLLGMGASTFELIGFSIGRDCGQTKMLNSNPNGSKSGPAITV